MKDKYFIRNEKYTIIPIDAEIFIQDLLPEYEFIIHPTLVYYTKKSGPIFSDTNYTITDTITGVSFVQSEGSKRLAAERFKEHIKVNGLIRVRKLMDDFINKLIDLKSKNAKRKVGS